MAKLSVLLIVWIWTSSSLAATKERIAMDFTYKVSQQSAIGKQTVRSGESIEREIGRGDIDTLVTMIPVLERKKAGPDKIMVEISIKNFREGDLISESNPQIVALQGKTKELTLKDETLGEDLKLSISAKSVQ